MGRAVAALACLIAAAQGKSRHHVPSPDIPSTYTVFFNSTQGPFEIFVRKSWAPRAAARFFELSNAGYYAGNSFFRVVPQFVVQFGVNGDPAVTKKWDHDEIKDEPRKLRNTVGTIAFANSGPDTRCTQVFVNMNDNTYLDTMPGFVPFGTVNAAGMKALRSINAQYGEKPDQRRLVHEGNRYLANEFPGLDYVTTTQMHWEGGKAPLERSSLAHPVLEAAGRQQLHTVDEIELKSGDATSIPPLGARVGVHYTAWLASDMKRSFDSSRVRKQPLWFTLGAHEVLPCLDAKVSVLSLKQRVQFKCPAAMAYGARGTPGGPVPPNADLVLDAELLGYSLTPEQLKQQESKQQEEERSKLTALPFPALQQPQSEQLAWQQQLPSPQQPFVTWQKQEQEEEEQQQQWQQSGQQQMQQMQQQQQPQQRQWRQWQQQQLQRWQPPQPPQQQAEPSKLAQQYTAAVQHGGTTAFAPPEYAQKQLEYAEKRPRHSAGAVHAISEMTHPLSRLPAEAPELSEHVAVAIGAGSHEFSSRSRQLIMKGQEVNRAASSSPAQSRDTTDFPIYSMPTAAEAAAAKQHRQEHTGSQHKQQGSHDTKAVQMVEDRYEDRQQMPVSLGTAPLSPDMPPKPVYHAKQTDVPSNGRVSKRQPTHFHAEKRSGHTLDEDGMAEATETRAAPTVHSGKKVGKQQHKSPGQRTHGVSTHRSHPRPHSRRVQHQLPMHSSNHSVVSAQHAEVAKAWPGHGDITQLKGHESTLKGHTTQLKGHETTPKGHTTQLKGHVKKEAAKPRMSQHTKGATGMGTRPLAPDMPPHPLDRQHVGKPTMAATEDVEFSSADSIAVPSVDASSDASAVEGGDDISNKVETISGPSQPTVHSPGIIAPTPPSPAPQSPAVSNAPPSPARPQAPPIDTSAAQAFLARQDKHHHVTGSLADSLLGVESTPPKRSFVDQPESVEAAASDTRSMLIEPF